MYCLNCGTGISEGTRFCPACGSGIDQAAQGITSPAILRGFSHRINDPAFARYIKSSNRWSAGFYIYGEISSEMDNPEALYIGFGIGGMFVTIALLQILGRKRSKTWDGTVENKKIKRKTHHDEHSVDEYLEYSVIVRGDNGKKHVIKTRSSDIYHYFRIGDRVRHHAGLKTLEKYDKTGDQLIPCNACGALCNIREDACRHCKCPLLK